jgi:hypothetical protein
MDHGPEAAPAGAAAEPVRRRGAGASSGSFPRAKMAPDDSGKWLYCLVPASAGARLPPEARAMKILFSLFTAAFLASMLACAAQQVRQSDGTVRPEQHSSQATHEPDTDGCRAGH